MVVRAPRKTRINNRYPWYYFLFFPDDFQFQDFRKINKENESIKWEWWIFVSCYLQSCFFFRHFQTVFSLFKALFNTFFFAKEHDKKRHFTSWICDSKTEMKVCYPWFVICNYVFWSVNRARTPPLYDSLWSIGLKDDFFPFNGMMLLGGLIKFQIRIKKTRLRKTRTLRSSFYSFIGTRGDKR